jgi:hypothetical protein
MQLSVIENDLTVAATALSALLLIRLFQLGLYRQFPWVVSYQVLQFIPMAAAPVLGTSSVFYTRIFEYSCLPSLLATLLIAYELVSHLYAIHPGLRVFNPHSIRFGILMAAAAAVPSVYSTHARWHDPNFACLLWVWMEGMRVTEIGVVVYMLNILVASRRCHVRFSRNLTLLGTALLLTFVFDAVGSTMLSALKLHGLDVYVLNIATVSATILVNATLILFLQPHRAFETSSRGVDQAVSSRLNALQHVLTICTRNLLR